MSTKSMFELSNPLTITDLQSELERTQKMSSSLSKKDGLGNEDIGVGDSVVVRLKGVVTERDELRIRIKTADGVQVWAPAADVQMNL